MQDTSQRYDLTQGSIGKKLMLFFLPIVVGTIFQQLYNTVDAMVVGRFVGKEALAAVGGSASQVINLCIGFFVALTGGASAVIAQLMGGRRAKLVSEAVHSALAFSILMGLAFTIVVVPFAPTILDLMGTPADTMVQSVEYLRVYFMGTVFVLLFNMGSSILRAVGDSRRPLYYLIICCVCNIVLDVLFVVGFHMGAVGAAWATVISQFFSTVLVLLQLCRAQEAYQVRLRELRIYGGVTKAMLRIGVPSGLQESMYNLANLILQVAVNSLGTVAVAAWSITMKVDGIYAAVSNALGVAVMSFAGQNFGAGKNDRVKQTFRVSMKIFLLLTVVMEGVILALGRWGLWIFTDDPAVVQSTWKALLILVPFYIVWTLIEGISGVLRGVGDAIAPFTMTFIGVCVVRVLWVGTVFPKMQNVECLAISFSVSWCVTALVMSIYYLRGKWLERKPAAADDYDLYNLE